MRAIKKFAFPLILPEKLIDKDGSKFIDKKELQKFFVNELKLNLNLESLNQLLRIFDKDGNNKISVVEFAENLFREDLNRSQVGRKKVHDSHSAMTYLAQYLYQKKKPAFQYFNSIDVDGNGNISKKEMRGIILQKRLNFLWLPRTKLLFFFLFWRRFYQKRGIFNLLFISSSFKIP